MFGSTANRLALPGSDIDVLITVPHIQSSHAYQLLFEVIEKLLRTSRDFTDVNPITDAQVPIIQVTHKQTQVSVDIVINRDDGLQGLALVSILLNNFTELRPLYFLVKAYLVYKNIHKPWKGGIGSFVLINMLTCYLQLRHTKRLARGEEELGEAGLHGLVIGFFNFMGRELKAKQVGLSILGGGFAFDKYDERLAWAESGSTPYIQNPLSPTEDLGKGLRSYSTIIRPLFDVTAASLVKHVREAQSEFSEGPGTNSFVEIILPEARNLRTGRK